METAQKHGLALSLVVLDVDHFKRFNDTYGHALGDRVLAGLGRVILDSVRANDIACRYGGEEFAVILPRTSPETARTIAERLREKFGERRFDPGDGPPVGATISLGLTGLMEEDGRESFFKRADQALYQAKGRGRNRTISL